MHAVNPRGGICFWNDHEGNQPILYPKPKDGLRLAGFPCVPVVGCVPNDDCWSGVVLPRHGILRLSEAAVRCEPTERHVKDSSLYRYEYRIHESPNFPWAYQVSVSLRFLHHRDTVHYGVIVARSTYCRNERLMPLSLGMSIYVATHEQACGVYNGEEEVFTSRRGLRPEGERYQVNEKPLRVETALGTLRFFQQAIFDDVELWSREPLHYLCLTLSAGRSKPMLLRPGEMRSGSLELSYLRK